MPMPLSPTRLFVCQACGAVLPIGEEHVGKKCRCGRCGKVSLVSDATPPKSPKSQPPKPRPPKAKAKTPKSMHGQQYGLWAPGEAPSSAELTARQPKYFPVYCRVCDTLMHARPEQVGKKLTCPDCGGKTVIKAPAKPKPKKSALVPDGKEYQLDPTQTIPVRPLPLFTPPTTPSQKTTDPIRQEQTARPKLPRLPIVQGVLKMLLRGPVPTWFIGLSAVGLIVAGTMMATAGQHPIVAIPFFVVAGLCGLMGLAAASAISLAILTESSEGNDRLYNPPGPMFLDWMGDFFYLLIPGFVASLPGAILAKTLEQSLQIHHQGIVMLLGGLLALPVLLLSSLENGSPLEIFSPRIFASLYRRPGHWLLFSLEAALLVGGTLLALAELSQRSPAVALLAIPLCVAASLLYFRLLGRFAWWLAESLPADKET